MIRHLLVLAILAASAGCSTGPRIEPVVGSEPSMVRERLRQMREDGPVPITILGDLETATGLTAEEIAAAAAQGVRGISSSFEPSTTTSGRRLVIGQGRPPLFQLCESGDFTPSFNGMFTAFCEDDTLIGATVMEDVGDWQSDPTRLIWRSVQRLTEDDYDRSYGLSIFGGNVGVGIGGSVGF